MLYRLSVVAGILFSVAVALRVFGLETKKTILTDPYLSLIHI